MVFHSYHFNFHGIKLVNVNFHETIFINIQYMFIFDIIDNQPVPYLNLIWFYK
jgi:hypothetical protein